MSEQVEDKQDRYRHANNKDHHPTSMMKFNIHDRKRLTFALPMLVVGGVALLFSYIYSSLILTFIGLGLVFWGSILYYITSVRYYPEELFRVVVEAYSKSMSTTLSRLGYSVESTTVLFYPKQLRLGGLTQGYIFIYRNGKELDGRTAIQLGKYLEEWDGDGGSSNSMDIRRGTTTTPVAYAHAGDAGEHSGMLIKAPAQGLIDLFESRLNANFALMSMEELGINLERLLMEEFMLADSVEMSMDGNDTVRVRVKGRDTAKICSSMHTIGIALCPVCSSIALAISKSTGKAVMVKESSVGKKRVDTTYSLLEMV